MSYATVDQVEAGYRELDADDKARAKALLDEAAVLIDAVASSAADDAKRVVSCRMVRRALGDGDAPGAPMGSTQGSMTAGPYTQSWTMSGGSAGELYLSKTERTILGVGNAIGAYNPLCPPPPEVSGNV